MQAAMRFCESQGYQVVWVAGTGSYAFFIHPRQAYGMMLEVAASTIPEAIPEDPRTQPGWAARWRDEHPLGIERMNAVSYAVRDLDGAIGFIQSLTDAPVIHRGVDADAGKESAYLWITDHMIEVMQGIAEDSEIGRSVKEKGPKIHSVTFKVKNLTRAAEYLRKQGVGVLGGEGSGHVAIDPAAILGALYIFTERAIPNDPRGASR